MPRGTGAYFVPPPAAPTPAELDQAIGRARRALANLDVHHLVNEQHAPREGIGLLLALAALADAVERIQRA